MDAPARLQYLADLPARLAAAVGAGELIEATRPPEVLGITRALEPADVWVGADRLPAPIPRVVLDIDPPIDARALCQAWGIARPVAVSSDVHQRRWQIFVAGEDLPDPYQRRIATRTFASGRWDIHLHLATRPSGDLPGEVAGASPAYDVLERGGEIRRIEVSPSARRSKVVRADHADARALLDAMAGLNPAWPPGCEARPDADFVVIYDGEKPAAGAEIGDDGQGTFTASRLCVSPDPHAGDAASALLDLLEAVALERGGDRLCLDGSAFLQSSHVPYLRHGYVVAPPYAGDADDSVWAERDIRWKSG